MGSEKKSLLKYRSFPKKDTPVNKKIESNSPSPPLVTLQRTLGNNVFGGILQTKLKVNEPGDIYEKEADRVADAVVSMPNSGIQMKCEECKEEESLQRQTMIQLSTSVPGGAQPVPPEISSKISSTRGSGHPMEQKTQLEMGSKMGVDFSGVKIHTDSTAVQLSEDLGAKAFTVAKDVYFNKGQYKPGSVEGKQLLAHELTHVLQQHSQTAIQMQPEEGVVNVDKDVKPMSTRWKAKLETTAALGAGTFLVLYIADRDNIIWMPFAFKGLGISMGAGVGDRSEWKYFRTNHPVYIEDWGGFAAVASAQLQPLRGPSFTRMNISADTDGRLVQESLDFYGLTDKGLGLGGGLSWGWLSPADERFTKGPRQGDPS